MCSATTALAGTKRAWERKKRVGTHGGDLGRVGRRPWLVGEAQPLPPVRMLVGTKITCIVRDTGRLCPGDSRLAVAHLLALLQRRRSHAHACEAPLHAPRPPRNVRGASSTVPRGSALQPAIGRASGEQRRRISRAGSLTCGPVCPGVAHLHFTATSHRQHSLAQLGPPARRILPTRPSRLRRRPSCRIKARSRRRAASRASQPAAPFRALEALARGRVNNALPLHHSQSSPATASVRLCDDPSLHGARSCMVKGPLRMPPRMFLPVVPGRTLQRRRQCNPRNSNVPWLVLPPACRPTQATLAQP